MEGRQDDHWPPLLSFVQAIAFLIFGLHANIPAMTTVAIGALFLPLAFCALVHALTDRAWLGVPAAWPLLASDQILRASREGLSDQLLTAVLCLFLAALLFSRRHRGWLVAAGVLLALAWYGKGSQIVLIPFFVGGAVLVHGLGVLSQRAFLGALLAALGLMFPRLHYNARHFGNPLHSTQTPVSAYYGLTDMDGLYFLHGFYSIYWGHELPGPSDRFAHPYLHARSRRRNLERVARPYLFGLETDLDQWGEWATLGEGVQALANALHETHRVRPWRLLLAELKRGVTPWRAWPRRWEKLFRIAGVLWGGVALACAPFLWGRRARRRRLPGGHSVTLATALLAGFSLLQALFIIVLWEVADIRLVYPTVLPALALGWGLAALPLEGGRRWGRRLAGAPAPAWSVPALGALFAAAVTVNFGLRVGALNKRQLAPYAGEPRKPVYSPFKELAEKLQTTDLGDGHVVLLGNRRMEALWFAPDGWRACGLPYAPPGDLLAVARYYRVTHIVQDWPFWRVADHYGMRRLFEQHRDAFELVMRRPYPVYRIHWERVPESLITPFHRLAPAWDCRRDLDRWEEELRRSTQRELSGPREDRLRVPGHAR